MGNKPSSSSCRLLPWLKRTNIWSNAPHDILVEIASRIDSIDDYISFRSVCSSWRFAATKDIFHQSSTIKLPWVMLENYNSKGRLRQQFFSLANGKLVCNTTVSKTERPYYSYHFESECQGWFFNHSTRPDIDINLTHLISGVRLDLPTVIGSSNGPRRSLEHDCIRKVTLSTHTITSPDFCIVFAACHGLLCYWRPGAVSWTEFEHPFKHCRDIAYKKDHLYVIDECSVFRCKIEGSLLVVSEKVNFTVAITYCGLYFVEPLDRESDSLLVVSDNRFNSDTKFCVFEVNMRNGTFKEVNNLGDGAIFFGSMGFPKYYIKNASMLAKSLHIKGVWPANCVYVMGKFRYPEEDELGGLDLHYYNFENRSYNSYEGGILSHIKHSFWDRSFLVLPSFS